MQYYLLMSGDTEADAGNEANLLGEESISIKTDQGKDITVTKFVDKVSKLNLKRH